MKVTDETLGDLFTTTYHSDINRLVKGYRTKTFGEWHGVSLLEALFSIGFTKINISFEDNSSPVTLDGFHCNLTVKKYIGLGVITEIDENLVFFGDEEQVTKSELFNIQIWCYEFNNQLIFQIEDLKLFFEDFNERVDGTNDLKDLQNCERLLYINILLPLFLQLKVMNHNPDLMLKFLMKDYNDKEMVVLIISNRDNLIQQHNEIAKFANE